MSRDPEVPVHRLAYETNAFCNEPCGFCFATFQTPANIAEQVHTISPDVDTDTVLTTAEVKTRIIEPYGEMGGSILHFTGGDPFLRKDLPELVDHALANNLLVSLDTNALVVTQPRNRGLFERVIPKLLRAGVPFDAPNKALQVAMRGHRLAYQAPLRFLQIAEELEPAMPTPPEIKINTLVTGMNYHHVPELVDILEPYIRDRPTNGRVRLVGRWSIDKFLPMERGATNRLQYDIDDDSYQETVATVRHELAARGLADIVTGDQPKVNTTLVVSPQGIAYVPTRTEKQFVPMSVRNTALRHIVAQTALASRLEQYSASLGGTAGARLWRHPEWESKFMIPLSAE